MERVACHSKNFKTFVVIIVCRLSSIVEQQQAKRPTRSQPGRSCKLKRNNPDCDSAIGQHLLDNEQCAANYNDKRFKILAVARNSFHLCLLEATFIKTKHPVLCKQKEFVYTLKLFK